MELALDREKKPLSAKALKGAKVYLAKIRQDRLKIKNLFDCFPSNKWPRDKSASTDSSTETKRQDRRSSRSSTRKTEEVKTDKNRSLSRQRASLGVDSQWSLSATQQGRDTNV